MEYTRIIVYIFAMIVTICIGTYSFLYRQDLKKTARELKIPVHGFSGKILLVIIGVSIILAITILLFLTISKFYM